MASFAQKVSMLLSMPQQSCILPGLGCGYPIPNMITKVEPVLPPAYVDSRFLPALGYAMPLPKKRGSRFSKFMPELYPQDVEMDGEDDCADAGALSTDGSYYSDNSYDSDGNIKPHRPETHVFHSGHPELDLQLPICSRLAQDRAIARGADMDDLRQIRTMQACQWAYDRNFRRGLAVGPDTLFKSINWNPVGPSEKKTEEVSPKTEVVHQWQVEVDQDISNWLDEVENADETKANAEWQQLVGGIEEPAEWHRTLHKTDDAVMVETVEWERTGKWTVLGYGSTQSDARYESDMSVD